MLISRVCGVCVRLCVAQTLITVNFHPDNPHGATRALISEGRNHGQATSTLDASQCRRGSVVSSLRVGAVGKGSRHMDHGPA